jgi:hypothetical protein
MSYRRKPVSSIIKYFLDSGFHPELSGRENIYLNGTILGDALHNYINPAIMSYRRKPVSSIIKYFLDSGFHRNDE